MGRGDAARRRRRVQERAAMLKGKRVLSADPEKAPKPGAQEVLSRATRKMLQLKAAAAAVTEAKSQRRAQRQVPQPQQQLAADQARQTTGGQPDAGSAKIADDQGYPPQPKCVRQELPETDQAPVVVPERKLKDKKKDFLRQKKKKKKKKQQDGGGLIGKEAEVAALAAVNRPAFGEQAKQPLKVQLKRKHWVGEGIEQGVASKRCTQIFGRQMAAARAAAAAAEATRDDGAGQHQQQRKSTGKKKQEQQQQRRDMAQPDEAVRQEVINVYRQRKLQRLEADGKTPLLSATAQSLAALVRRDAGKASFH